MVGQCNVMYNLVLSCVLDRCCDLCMNDSSVGLSRCLVFVWLMCGGFGRLSICVIWLKYFFICSFVLFDVCMMCVGLLCMVV